MALESLWLSGNSRLQRCLVSDPDHVQTGDQGPHVLLIQQALAMVDNDSIDAAEMSGMRYGKSTAAATLRFKTRRNIINRSYQNTPDDIVGKMTIQALDKEMQFKELGLLSLAGAAAPYMRGLLLAAGARTTRNIVIVSSNEPAWLGWARNFKDNWTKNTSGTGLGVEIIVVPGGAAAQTVSSALQLAAARAGAGGFIVLSVGHGGVKDNSVDGEDGQFDLGPAGSLSVGGINAWLIGEPRPAGVKKEAKPAHTSLGYDIRQPNVHDGKQDPLFPFFPSKKDNDDKVKARDPNARARLDAFSHFDAISKRFKATGLGGIVLLTCRVGSAGGFLTRMSQRWGAPIIAYRRRVMGQSATANSKPRVFLEGDPPGLGTNTVLGEVFIPISSDMVVVV